MLLMEPSEQSSSMLTFIFNNYTILFGEAYLRQRNLVKHFSFRKITTIALLGTFSKECIIVHNIDVQIEEFEEWTTSREFSEIETQSSVTKTQRLWSLD